jgi:hypothetical protein
MTTPKPPSSIDAELEREASEEETRAAAELRDALANPAIANEDAELLRAIALAESPRPLGDDEHRLILERALARRSVPRGSGGRVIRVVFGGAATALALAAAVALFLQTPAPVSLGGHPQTPGSSPQALARTRSTQPLFGEPFARQGGESSRIDRIALARASDLRDNEFSRWGVR